MDVCSYIAIRGEWTLKDKGIRSMSERIFRVAGMDCAEETNALRQAVGALTGIEDVKFNLLNGTMTVTAAEATVDERDIISAVRHAGMIVRPADREQATVFQSESTGFWLSHGRAVMCAASGIAVAAGFLSHWLLHGNILD